jgi:hypothetical protein
MRDMISRKGQRAETSVRSLARGEAAGDAMADLGMDLQTLGMPCVAVVLTITLIYG